MSETFKVFVTGDMEPGQDRDSVVRNIELLFKMDAAKAEKLVSGRRVVIKKGLDEAKAKAIAARLQKAGAKAGFESEQATPELQLEPMNPTKEPAPDESTAAPAQASGGLALEPLESGEDSATGGQSEPPVPPPVASTPADVANGAGEWQNKGGYDFMFEGKPDFAFARVKIPAGEMLKVEAAAMATMDSHLQMKTKLGGGFKRFLSGESVFINEFTAEGAEAEIGIAPSIPGDLAHMYLNGDVLMLQNSAFVASSGSVEIETKWQGFTKGFFSGEGLFLIRAVGIGDLWFNTFGAMIEVDVDGEYVVDNGHIVAFTPGLEYKMTKIGGFKSFFLSGEGLVCRFTGKGKVWIQSRQPQPFSWWARAYRPVKKRG